MAGRKKKTEAELLDPSEETPASAKPVTRMVDAEHTIKYREPVPVPVAEESEEESAMLWEDDENRPKKLKKSLREKLRDKLEKGGITNTEGIYLRIDRFINPDAIGNDGMNGDKEFCWRGPCTIEYVTNDDYLTDTAKRHGPGNYWFTLRNQKSILATWQFKIGGLPQTISTPDPITGQPQIIYQPAQSNGQTVSLPDPIKQMKGTLEMMQLMNEMNPQTQLLSELLRDKIQSREQPSQENLPPKVALLSAIADHPDLVEGIMDKLTGGAKNGSREPSLTELLIKHGADLANAFGNMVQGVVRTVASEFKEIRSMQAGEQSHVENQMATQTLQDQDNQQRPVSTQLQFPSNQKQQEGQQGNDAQNIRRYESTGHSETSQATQTNQSPEEALLALVCDNCARNIPPKITAQRIDEFAAYINENHPHLSIDGWIDMFIEQEVDSIINLASQGIFGEQGKALAEASHARGWIGDLRETLKQEQPEGEEEQ